MNKKLSRIKFIITTIVLYILLYVILKLFLVYVDDLFMSNEVYNNEYGLAKVMDSKNYTAADKNNTEYFTSESKSYKMKVKNYFSDFEQGDKDESYEYQMLYDEENNIKATFMMGIFDTRIDSINDYTEDGIYYEFNHFPLYISKNLRNKLLENNNIKNDVDLVKHIRERKKINSNFFTTIIKMKENYFFNFLETTLPDLTTVTYIEGDKEGIIYESANYKQACIIKNNKLYCLIFYKLDYFNDDIIYDIINSLEIEK